MNVAVESEFYLCFDSVIMVRMDVIACDFSRISWFEKSGMWVGYNHGDRECLRLHTEVLTCVWLLNL